MTDEPDLTIRLAGVEDLDEIMGIAFMASQENSATDYDAESLLQDIWPALNRDKGLVGVIGTEGGPIEGVILLRLGTLWYSKQVVIEEKNLTVLPEYRAAKGGRAKRLMEFAKEVSDYLGLPLMIGVLSNERTEAKVRAYQRMFGKPAGAFWLYNSATGGHDLTVGVA